MGAGKETFVPITIHSFYLEHFGIVGIIGVMEKQESSIAEPRMRDIGIYETGFGERVNADGRIQTRRVARNVVGQGTGQGHP